MQGKKQGMPFIFLLIALVFNIFSSVEAAEIVLKTETGEIYGSLEFPANAQRVPLALIISGSGPTDRDGNIAFKGKNNSLKMLAENLASKGIASFRYDKRGIAASSAAGPREEDLRFDTYIEDAVRWGRLLLQDQRFTSLIILGHSEGALIGSVACRRLGAQGFISIAGAGRPAFELIEAQLNNISPPDILAESKFIIDHLKKGTMTDKVPPSLMALFRPSVQPYLISWFRYDPAQELSQLTVPALVVQGMTDIQVSTSDAEQLAKANSLTRLLLVGGMNHVLKTVPDDVEQQIKSYSDPGLPIPPELTDEIAVFINELNSKGRKGAAGKNEQGW